MNRFPGHAQPSVARSSVARSSVARSSVARSSVARSSVARQLATLALALAAGAAAGTVMAPAALEAQDAPWRSRHQQATWIGAFLDQPLGGRWALWFDGQWRRMGAGAEPQQLLLRPAVQYTVAPGVRVAAGYGYVATAPYGALPIANPTREHRSWQQLSLSHAAGGVSLSHRYRLEQRRIAPQPTDSTTHQRVTMPSSYANRVRYLGRVQGNLPALRLRGRPILGFAWDELLMPIGGGGASLQVTQNRAAIGVGLPIDARQRLEVGYMNLWNAFASRRANEVNHTFTLSWLWTPPAARAATAAPTRPGA